MSPEALKNYTTGEKARIISLVLRNHSPGKSFYQVASFLGRNHFLMLHARILRSIFLHMARAMSDKWYASHFFTTNKLEISFHSSFNAFPKTTDKRTVTHFLNEERVFKSGPLRQTFVCSYCSLIGS